MPAHWTDAGGSSTYSSQSGVTSGSGITSGATSAGSQTKVPSVSAAGPSLRTMPPAKPATGIGGDESAPGYAGGGFKPKPPVPQQSSLLQRGIGGMARSIAPSPKPGQAVLAKVPGAVMRAGERVNATAGGVPASAGGFGLGLMNYTNPGAAAVTTGIDTAGLAYGQATNPNHLSKQLDQQAQTPLLDRATNVLNQPVTNVASSYAGQGEAAINGVNQAIRGHRLDRQINNRQNQAANTIQQAMQSGTATRSQLEDAQNATRQEQRSQLGGRRYRPWLWGM